jgi:L-methionine (R)-S-oxide reductase
MSFDASPLPASNPEEFYSSLAASLQGLLSGESDGLAQLSNASALLAHHIPDLNWLGFYLLKGGELVVGPFQGKPACTRIRIGKGVCGTAAQALKPIVVDDVDAFPGHIACDAESRSEIVVPLFSDGKLVGVLDVDSPHKARFTEVDAAGIVGLAEVISRAIHWDTLGLS